MASIEKRISDDGETAFRVKVRLKGHPAQSATFERITDAKKWAAATETAIREGRHFKTTEAKRHTAADMVDRYLRDILPKKKANSQPGQKRQLLWWKDQIGTYSLADVTSALVIQYRDKLATEPIKPKKAGKEPLFRSPSTIARYLAALSHCFTVAMKEWQWIDDNPLRKVSKPKEPRGIVRFLSDDEREELLKACRASKNKDLYLAVVLALSTGARSMEIMSLRWPQVDTGRRMITLHDTKNGEIRALPLVGHACELMQERSKVRRIDTDLVFPGKKAKAIKSKTGETERVIYAPVDLRAPWLAALKEAKISDFRFHDLRHTCASYLAMNGATLAEIAEVLGHKTLQMVKRYAHLSQAHTSRVVESMNAKMFG